MRGVLAERRPDFLGENGASTRNLGFSPAKNSKHLFFLMGKMMTPI
jgi:hypothetical protein